MLPQEMKSELFGLVEDYIFKAPIYVIMLEASLLLLGGIYILFFRNKSVKKLTPAEKEEILSKWKPEPLVEEVPEDHPGLKNRIVDGWVGKYVFVDGHKCLNMASHNYLGLEEFPEIKEKSIGCLEKYGVGSCGPRGFYGTLDVHLELEERLAKFMNHEEAILYSYAFVTVASAIPAYSKKGDVIFVDECVHFAIQKGLDASRSKIVFFKHNNTEDLEEKLKEQERFDLKNPKKAAMIRRFLVVEGIYMNTGEMCPLEKIVELRGKYKLRLILDETVSFGTIGKNGRGVTEHLDIDKTEVDLICASLESSVESVGGFCVGTSFIVEHQRLSGLGYCFSASQPPFLTQAAICALELFENDPNIFKQLKKVAMSVDEKFKELTRFQVRGHPISPIKHLYLIDDKTPEESEMLLRKISDQCFKMGLAVVPSSYLPDEKFPFKPSIRISVNRLLTDDEISNAFNILQKASIV